MQFHACLLLSIITTDKILASSHPRCGGNISLVHEPAGHISLTAPGVFPDTNRLKPVSHQTHQRPLGGSCTWWIDIPLGQTLHLKLVRLEGGASVSVRCVRNEEDQVLERGQITQLSGCDEGKADLTWKGAGHSSNAIQLSYYVQEGERNSLEDRTSPHSDLVSQTGTSFTRAASVGQEVTRGTQGSTARLHQGLKSQSVSGPGLLQPTSPLLGLTVAGRTDRETLPLPEEAPNNGADTSGRVHLTDSSTSVKERTHPYFHTQPTIGTHTTFYTQNTEINYKLPKIWRSYTPSSSVFRSTAHHRSTHVVQPPAHTTLSSSSVPPHSSSPTTQESLLTPHGEAVSQGPVEKPPDSWRSQRSTDTLSSDAVTRDPLQSVSGPRLDDSSSAHTDTKPTPSASSSSSQSSSRTHPSPTHVTDAAATAATSFHSNVSEIDSFVSAASDVTSRTRTFEITTTKLQTDKSDLDSGSTQRNSEDFTHSPSVYTFTPFRQATEEETQRNVHLTAITVTSSPDSISSFTGSPLTPTAPLTPGDVFLSSTDTEHQEGTETTHPTHALLPENLPTHWSLPPLASTSLHASTLENTLQTMSPSTVTPSTSAHTDFSDHQTTPTLPLPSSTIVPATHDHSYITTTHADLPSFTTTSTDHAHGAAEEDEFWHWSHSNRTHSPTAATPSSQTDPHVSHDTQKPSWSTTTKPKFYIVPDQPAVIRVKSIELLLQIIVEETRSASPSGLEEDTTAWVEPYLLRASGFSRLLGVWSSGHAVQSLVEFRTSGALQWLSAAGPTSLLEQSGLAQAVREGRSFRSSRIINVTLGGLQGDVCDWLLQCPAGYKCVSQPGTANYSCSSVCHFDHCHHHGICTQHPGQLPVCRCLVGEDYWFMGQRCDVRMTRARLVGTCLAILLIIVTVIAVLALVAVRRYRAMLIQAKVDQTRSSYRRFNHFDELSGRFWLRSLAGSADSLDNPAFTRSDELLHLRALDRPCCYHDDTLSLASTCPSHGTHINTIYPHSSQYGWRGSEMSMGDGVLDSGKVSDLSVCSWPVEPIHWTPFPLLQQLASHRTPMVRVSRPRSYCEGMELVDLGKSWTA